MDASSVVPLLILLLCYGVLGYNGEGDSFTEDDFSKFLSSFEVPDSPFSENPHGADNMLLSSTPAKSLDPDRSFPDEESLDYVDTYKRQQSVRQTLFTDYSFDEEDYVKFLDGSLMKNSYTEEEWNSFVQREEVNSDLDLSAMDDISDTDSDSSHSDEDGMDDDLGTADPEFFGEIYALPRQRSLTFGETPPTRESGLAEKALDKRNILSSKSVKCKCDKQCMRQFSSKDIFHLRERYWCKSRQAQAQILLHTASLRVRTGRHTYMRLDTGKEVCQRAFCALLRLDKNTITNARKKSDRSAKASVIRSEKSFSKKTIQAMNWFEDFAKAYGDRMPNTKDILLPYKTRKVCVFEKYKTDVQSSDRVSKTMFFSLWKERFPYLKIKEVNSFSQCVKCAAFAKKLEQTLKPSRRAKILKRRALHHERQMLERKYYYRKREQSRADPEGYLSLIIDGMDQAKSNLPHFTGRRPKNINPFDLLKTHITGVINHGQRRFDTYIDMNQWPHDPNLTINILLLALKKAALTANNKLPGILFLQADNCWRENKNKYVLSFCEILIREKIFNEIHLSFLMVGHTHEDVDAGFSQISSKLKQTDVETYEELMKVLPNPMDIKEMFDVKSWLEKHLTTPKKHSRPLHYRFIRSADGEIEIQYKGLHNQQWKVLRNTFFKAYENKKPYLPSGTPKLLKPVYDKDSLDRLSKQVNTIRHLFSKEEHFEWWNSFIREINRNRRLSTQPEWILKTLPRQTDRPIPDEENDDIPAELDRLLQMETEETEVIITKTTVPKRKVQQTRRLKNPRTSNNKRNGRKHIYITVQRTVLVPMDKEEKKHIWYMIICMLLSNLVLFFVTETLLLLYILLWTKSCCDYFLLMEWLNKQYVTANYALNSIDRYMCDHLIDIMCAQHQLPMPLVAVNDGTCTYQYYSVHNLL